MTQTRSITKRQRNETIQAPTLRIFRFQTDITGTALQNSYDQNTGSSWPNFVIFVVVSSADK